MTNVNPIELHSGLLSLKARLSLELDDSDVDDEETGGECRLHPVTSTGYSIIPSEFRDIDPSLFE